jgi:hypothetical protein
VSDTGFPPRRPTLPVKGIGRRRGKPCITSIRRINQAAAWGMHIPAFLASHRQRISSVSDHH